MTARINTVQVTETYKVPDFSARIKRGMDLLDKRAPGWALKIDLEEFDLGDTSYCVVGQLAIKEMLNGPLDGYYDGISKLWPNASDSEVRNKARLHAFCLSDDDYEAVAKMLSKEPDYHPWKGIAEDHTDSALAGVLYEFLSQQWVQVIRARQEAAEKAKERRERRAVVKKTAKKTAARRTR